MGKKWLIKLMLALNNAKELRIKATNPRARKAAEFLVSAEQFETIVSELKAIES